MILDQESEKVATDPGPKELKKTWSVKTNNGSNNYTRITLSRYFAHKSWSVCIRFRIKKEPNIQSFVLNDSTVASLRFEYDDNGIRKVDLAVLNSQKFNQDIIESGPPGTTCPVAGVVVDNILFNIQLGCEFIIGSIGMKSVDGSRSEAEKTALWAKFGTIRSSSILSQEIVNLISQLEQQNAPLSADMKVFRGKIDVDRTKKYLHLSTFNEEELCDLWHSVCGRSVVLLTKTQGKELIKQLELQIAELPES